jgi:adenylate kinase
VAADVALVRLSHVLWLGGMSGVGKTTAARALAGRHDLKLYSLDAHTYEHARQLPPEARSLDEVWVDTTPEELADSFERAARERFRLVLADLLALPEDVPVIVEGPQLLPEQVAPLLASPQAALFVVAERDVQRRLVTARGSDLYARTRDPGRALENRLRRDEELARRVRAAAAGHGLPVVAVSDVRNTRAAVESRFTPLLADWIAQADHGDVAARRRDENDVRLRQLRAHLEATGAARDRSLDFSCECPAAGCTLSVRATPAEVDAARARSEPLLAPAHGRSAAQ